MLKWTGEHALPNVQVNGYSVSYVKGNTDPIEAAVQTDSPSPKHNKTPIYYEVKVDKLEHGSVVAVGYADSEFPPTGALPGWRINSWGFHSDDGKAFSHEIATSGKDFAAPFKQGDVVGCGVDTSNRMFFTLNGVLLGSVFSDICGMDLYPTVGFDIGAQITANFGTSPFMFDLTKLPTSNATPAEVHVSGQSTELLHLPREILGIIVDEAAVSPRVLYAMARVNRTFYRLLIGTTANHIWERLSRDRWFAIPSSLKVSNWYKFYKKRHLELKNHYQEKQEKEYPIENCAEWEFKCPVALEKLRKTSDCAIDYCTVCKKNVYLCTTETELMNNVAQGHCVAWDEGGVLTNLRKPRMMKRGKVRVTPRPPAATFKK